MAIIYSILTNLPLIFIGIIGIGFIIGFHELGHFAFCKLFRVKTPSFSIGFGPQLIKKKIGETTFSLSAIPFGGYVEIAGIQEVGQGDQKDAKLSDKFSFSSKPYYQKLLILSGGILFNILISYVLMTLLFTLGAPKTPLLNADSIPPVIGKIINDSSAKKYDLHEGDTILAINKNSITSSLELHKIIRDLANKEAVLMLQRDGQTIHKELTIGSVKAGDKDIGQLGIQFAPVFSKPVPILQAFSDGFHATNQMLFKMAGQFKSIFQNKQYQAVGGPIMIISEVANSAKHGFRIFLLLLVIISLNLAILNLIPIPILDGGQILFTTIEAIIRRPIPENIRIGIHYVCWIAAISLFLYLSYKDIFKLLK
jgi:regulator of sigma E protease